MINLLPPDALTILQADYRRQRRTVAAAAGLGLLAAGSLILGVLFYKVGDDLAAAQTALALIKDGTDGAALAALDKTTALSQAELAALAPLENAGPALTQVLTTLTGHGQPGLLLTDFLYDDGGKEPKVGLQGSASTRTVYLEWLKALRADPLVAEVSAPLTDIIRLENIRFSIALTLKTTKHDS